MQATAAYIGNKQCLDVAARGNETREAQDVFSRYLPLLHRTAYRYLANTADAEDAVQDALLSAYKHLDQFRGQAQISTWLVAIVSNCARMQLRRRPRQLHLSLNEQFGDEQGYTVSDRLADCGPSPEEAYQDAELHERIMQFAEELSPPLRRAFQLRDLDGLTTSEASTSHYRWPPDAFAGAATGVTRHSGQPMTTSFFVRWSVSRRLAISS